MEKHIKILHSLPEPLRVDRALTNEFPTYSRSYFQQLIQERCILVNGAVISKPSLEVKEGDTLEVTFPPLKPIGALPLPANELGVKIVHQHDDFLIIYKPAGLLVHAPTQHSKDVTLVDWLVHSFQELKTVGAYDRPAIVHRLDKDTSGLMIIPRNGQSHALFTRLFHDRLITKTYHALVQGHPVSGTIDYAIGRDPFHNGRMASLPYGRPAVTHYKVLEYYKDSSLIEVHPITGRTHQIRVHFSTIGHPIIADALYGSVHANIERQALHAHSISFMYKDTYYSFSYTMPADMRLLVETLQS